MFQSIIKELSILSIVLILIGFFFKKVRKNMFTQYFIVNFFTYSDVVNFIFSVFLGSNSPCLFITFYLKGHTFLNAIYVSGKQLQMALKNTEALKSPFKEYISTEYGKYNITNVEGRLKNGRPVYNARFPQKNETDKFVKLYCQESDRTLKVKDRKIRMHKRSHDILISAIP